MSRVVAKGRFRVDRRRALEKLEKFQLEDPLRYVLEWLAAAVVAGAERIEVRNDSDDFEIAWGGVALGTDDLDALFDHLFGRATEPQQAMLQHLAVGVLGALARKPRWLYVDSDGPDGPLRLSVDDPASCAAAPLDATVGGLRCHVRDRLTQETALEALLLAFRDPAEARLIRGAARWCQVPVLLNGTLLPPPASPPVWLLSWSGDDARLWVVPDEHGHGVDVVRHGIVVHELKATLGPCRVVGWVRGDDVRLNASRSAVVDRDLAAVRARLTACVDRMLGEELVKPRSDRHEEVTWGERALGFPRARATRGEVYDALVLLGLERPGKATRPLETVSALPDLRGRRWSLRDLRLESVGWVDDDRLLDWADGDTVLFAAVHRPIVARVKGARDLSHELRVRQAVARRKAALEHEPRMPWAIDGRPPQLTKGMAKLKLGLSVRPASSDLTRVHLLLDGARLTTVTTGGVGVGIEALVQGPFTLAGIEAEVAHDEVYQRAIDAVQQLRYDVVLAWLKQASAEDALRGLTRVARPVLGPLDGRAARTEAVAGLPEGLRRLPLVPWQGTTWSLERMLDSAEPAYVVDRLPEGCPASVAERTLVVPGRLVHDWATWLDVAEPGRAAVDRAVRRAHKLAGPRRQAKLVPPPAHRTLVKADGLEGELGHGGFDERSVASRLARRAGLVGPAEGVTVLWKGVEVGSVAVPQLPGTYGIVNGDDLALTDDLTLTPQAKSAVEKWARRGTLRLVLSLWDAVEAGERLPHALMEWLVRRQQHVPGAEARRPTLYRVNGEALTLEDLRRLDKRKKGSRKLVVLRRHPGDVPGFDEAVAVTDPEHALLVALSKRGWRDGDGDLRDATEQLHNLTSLPAWQPPLRPLAHRAVTGRGWKGQAYLPRDLDRVGELEVVALFRGRQLAVRKAKTSAGVLLVVDGLGPNRRCTDVADPKALTRLKDRSESLLIDMVEELLESGHALDDLPAMRLLAARVKEGGGRNRHLAKLARKLRSLPLLRMLSGDRRSPDQLAARKAAGKPIVRVAPTTRSGPADHEGYVLNEPGVSELLRAWLGRSVPDGTGGLDAWRRGQKRRREARRVSPRPTGSRSWKLEGALTGFVSLLDGEPGLYVEPVCQRIALQPLRVPFPLAVSASVTGEAIAAATDWTTVADPASVKSTVRSAVEARLDQAVHDGELRGHEARTVAVTLGPDSLAATVALFPRVGGGLVSLADLAEAGQTYVASHDRIAPPCGWTALVGPPEGLEQWVRLVSLDGLLALMDQAPRDLPPVDALAQQKVPGGLLWVSEARPSSVDVLIERRVVGRLTAPPGLLVEGSVQAGDVEPRPDGTGLVPGPAVDALRERLAGWADALVEQVARRLPHDDRARRALTLALVDKLEQKKGLATLRERRDPLLGAPLFADSAGVAGSLEEVVEGDEIGWVDGASVGGVEGERLWVLPASVREVLVRYRRLVDRTRHLKQTLEGQRRRERRYPAPMVPSTAVHGTSGEARWSLWSSLRFAASDSVDVVVDGARVQSIDLGAGGLLGVLEGPFATDRGFTEATVPAAVRERMEADATELLTREFATDPARWMGRMTFLRKRGHDLSKGPTGAVAVAFDGRGEGVTVAGVLKRPKQLRWVLPDQRLRGPEAKRLVGTDEQRRWLVHGLGVELAVLEAAPKGIDEQLVAPVRALVDLPVAMVRRELKHVPDELRGLSSEAARWLVAWGVASRAVTADDELALLERMVDGLVARVRADG